ncbi:AfsR/SARP family transcriptional regulator [Streptomyces sp. NPDC092296]|uniref:AfsR/SARP family transcriptional regulator n=1 Tax=Streptomyces sp. NPDC092296 TaxID=3366012 RepID=UPI00381E9A0A
MGLQLDGRRLELGSDKARILVASLALDVGRPVALDTLIHRLWDGEPRPNARENTHTYISRIRKRLRPAGTAPSGTPRGGPLPSGLPRGGPPHSDLPRIVGRAHTYVLEADPDSVDWHRFQRLTGAPTAGDDEHAVELLRRAAGLWQGEALAGLPGLWAETVRRTLAERWLGATVARVAAELRLGRFADLVGELSDLVDRHPGNETLLGQLMLAYYGSGRYTDALRVYERTRRLLMAEYGSRPGAELNRIHRGVLDRVPVPDLVGGRAVRAAAAAPPTPPVRLPPRNLPQQSPLVGRRAELRALSEVVDAAADGSVISLETVTGMAGVGKTAVAVSTASRLATRFPEAQIYVDLRGHSPAQEPLSPDAALATLLRLLGAPADTIPGGLEERTALWRTMLAERRAVIVLDDAIGPDQILPLLPGDSPSLVIITSRRHLTGLPHARAVPLDVMPPADAITLFRRFAGEGRTRDTEEIARIVCLCGYLPLAIELVANRFRVRSSWTLATLSGRLARSPGRLSEIRDSGDHEMARAFDLSYRTLTPAQRTAFRRLALHPGPDFTVSAAAALLGLPPEATERLLEALLTCHLLREPVPDRYQYHDLLREYARFLAASEDGEHDCDQAVCRLTDFYLQAADQADRLAYPRRIRLETRHDGLAVELPYPPDAEAARSWFAAERENLLAVENHARTHGQPERAARLAYFLAGFLDAECHWQDAGTVLQHAAAHWDRTGAQAALCRALFHLSVGYTSTGRYAEAAEAGERGLAIARTRGDTEAEAELLRVLGALNWHLGEHRTALDRFRQSLAIKARAGDVWENARGHNNIAITLLFLGEHDQALDYFHTALDGFLAVEDRTALAKTLNNMGDLYMRAGKPDLARKSLEQAMSFLGATGNRYDRATVRGSLADLLTESGEAEAALPLYREMLLEFQELGDRKSQADTLIGLGEAHRRTGDHAAAARYHLDALELARAIGAAHQVTQALRCLGQAESAGGRPAAAAGHLREAVAMATRTQDLDEAVRAQGVLAEVLLAVGDLAGARVALQRVFDSGRPIDRQEAVRTRERLIRLERKQRAGSQ